MAAFAVAHSEAAGRDRSIGLPLGEPIAHAEIAAISPSTERAALMFEHGTNDAKPPTIAYAERNPAYSTHGGKSPKSVGRMTETAGAETDRRSVLDPGAQRSETSPAVTAAREAPATPGHVEPARILVVDDSAVVRATLRLAIRVLGHAVEVAESGEAALATLRERAFEVVVLAILMPGFDVLAAMQADDVLRDIPVIGLAACSDNRRFPSRVELDSHFLPLERLNGRRKLQTSGLRE